MNINFTLNLYCHLLCPNAGRLLHGEETLQGNFWCDLLLGGHKGGEGGQVFHMVILREESQLGMQFLERNYNF